MSTREKKTITEFMIEEQRRFPEAMGDFTAVLNHVRLACKRISFIVGRGALAAAQGAADSVNVQGEQQMKLDVISNDIFLRTTNTAATWRAWFPRSSSSPIRFPPNIRSANTCWSSTRSTVRAISTSTRRWAAFSPC